MKVFVLALCLVMAVGDHDTTTEPDVFCRAVTIFFNQANLNCQTLMQASLTVCCTHGQTLTRLIFFFQFRVILMLSVPVTALNNLRKLSMIVTTQAMLM